MKQILLLIICSLFVLSFPFTVYAQSNLRTGEIVTLSTNEIVNKDYFAAGKNVSLDGIVNGDAYLAGGGVTINGVINGDVLVAGGNITINGDVTGNVRVAGGNISISGKIGRNITAIGGSINLLQSANVVGSLTVAGGNINIFSPIAKDIVVAGGQVNIENSVSGDINAVVRRMIISSGAKVNGNIVYWSENKAVIASDSSVVGTITQHIPPKSPQPDYQSMKKVGVGFLTFFKLISFLTALVIGLLLIKLLPVGITTMTTSVSNHWLQNLGIGFLVLAITPLLLFLLFVTLIGFPIAIIWMFFILFDLWVAKIFVALSIGLSLMKYFKQTWSMYLTYLFGLIVYFIIGLIPVIGWIFGCITTLIGLGTIIVTKKQYYLDLRQKKLI
jgi:hypothetical protein